MHISVRGAGAALITSATLVGSLAMAGPANAASTPIEACGGGSYHEIDHHDLSGARIDLLYNGTTNCVVMWKTTSIGSELFVGAALKLADGDLKAQGGQYKFYAGPIKVNAAGKCIVWGGGVGPGVSAADAWLSQPEHCG